MITFDEYLNQKQVVKLPVGSVQLKEGEYKIVATLPNIGLSCVVIPFWGFAYVLKSDSKVLYTQDDFGNPKTATVFCVE